MSYKEQLKKVKRFLNKIDPVQKYHGDQIEYEDNLWSFFQNAWHLKDHIKNDESINQFPIESVVDTYLSLKICADLANRTKHLKLTKMNRVDAKHFGTDVKVVIPISLTEILSSDQKPYPIIKAAGSLYNYVIQDSSGAKYNAIELAHQIVKDWEEIIANNVENKIIQ